MARSSSRVSRTYRSKVDLWFVAILAVAGVAALGGALVAALEDGWLRALQAGFIVTGVYGLIIWVFAATHYTLDGRRLVVRSGPLSWRIPLADIHSIEPARGLLRLRSGPALSRDRLVITYGRGRRLLVSPADPQRFIADIRSRQ